jgi:hypothetical protein
LAATRGGLGQGGAAWTPTFLLRDDFTTTAGAPLTSPRTAEPGPGTLTIVTDSGPKMSIASGDLVWTSSVANFDPRMNGPLLARAAGRTYLFEVIGNAGGFQFGLEDSSGNRRGVLYFNGTAVTIAVDANNNFDNQNVATIVLGTRYNVAFSRIGSAQYGYFIKGGAFTSWTLLWIEIAGDASATRRPFFWALGTASSGKFGHWRYLDLPAPYATDYGLATQRLSGARSALDAFSHEANCLIEFTDTTRPSASNLDFRFRRQDATNYWQVTIDSTGAFTLNEVVAGTPTQRATAAAVVSSGHRIVIVADSTTIKGYSNNVLRWTYSSASNFATSTAGELTALGTTGAVSDVVAWPRTISGAAATYLDLAVA